MAQLGSLSESLSLRSLPALTDDRMDHGGHHGMPMAGCKMSMVWNTSPYSVCLVFPSLQIGTTRTSLLFWLIFLAAVSATYEWTRLYSSTWDARLRTSLRGAGGNLAAVQAGAGTGGVGGRRQSSAMGEGSEELLLGAGSRERRWGVVKLPISVQSRRSLMYVGNMALSVYLMLIFMSYNAQIIGAVLVGAFIGHFIFHRTIDLTPGAGEEDKVGCH